MLKNEILSGIYKIIFPNSKIYIGQSVNISRRLRQYKRLKNCSRQPALFSAFQKTPIEQCVIEILELCSSKKELDLREIYWIKFYNSNAKDKGYNITTGGQGGNLGEEINKKRSFLNKTRKLPDDFRQRIILAKSLVTQEEKREIQRKRQLTIESRSPERKLQLFAKRSLAKKGQIPWNKGKVGVYSEKQLSEMRRPKSEEHRAKLRKPKTEEHKRNLKLSKALNKYPAHNRRPIVQLSMDLVFIRKWNFVSEAAKELSLGISNISKACRDSTKSCGGFKWEYIN